MEQAGRLDMNINARPGPGATNARRCAYTLLTKPECHCPSCLSEQIAVHAPRSRRALEVTAVARRP
jgi:hypothetical protein